MSEHKHVRQYDSDDPKLENQPGLLNKLRLGRVALAGTVIEVPAALASIISESSAYIAGGSYLTAVVGGVTLYEAHNHFRNGYPIQSPLSKALIKGQSPARES